MATQYMVRHTQAASDRSYAVIVDSGAGAEARMCQALMSALPGLGTGARLFVMSDENVAPLHLERYMRALSASGLDPRPVIVAPGEGSKRLAVVEQVARGLLAAGADRETVLLALGGGVVSDLCGFVAAILLRGLSFAACPTTLLAMADAAIGGKTAVNLPEGKNLIGAFHSPHLVYADLSTLSTLPERERCSGLGEVLKHALLIGDDTFELFLARAEDVRRGDPGLLEILISRSCRFKAEVVERDPFERDLEKGRIILNLGHTVGHALERASHEAAEDEGPPLCHGEAVALGLLAIARVGVSIGVTHADLLTALAGLLPRLGLRTDLDARLWKDPARPELGLLDPVFRALASDKKRGRDRLRLVLLERPGRAQIASMHVDELLQHLAPGGAGRGIDSGGILS